MVTTKNKLKKLLKKRSGIAAEREVVKPANLYEHKLKAQSAKRKAGEPKGDAAEVLKSEGAPRDKKGAKDMKKFASYVTAQSYKKLKLIAVKNERKMYDVIQDAINDYINRHS